MSLAPWTFTLFNLRVQLEKAHLGEEASKLIVESDADQPRHKRLLQQLGSRGVVSNKFFFATAALSLVLLMSTMIVFFLFPRVSFGYLLKKVKAPNTESGFSENVDLNSFGDIKLNNAVVMRVELDASDRFTLDDLYWRGLAFDKYTGKRWKQTYIQKKRRPMGFFNTSIRVKEIEPKKAIVQKIFLEPLKTEVIFAVDPLYQIRWDKLRS